MAKNMVAVAAELKRLVATDGEGFLSPERVLQEAVDESSPLHDYFEWDDTEAARKFRLVQAGLLVRRVRVEVLIHRREARVISGTIVRIEGGQRRIPMFASPRGSRGRGGGYRLTEEVIDDPVLVSDLEDTLRTELGALILRLQSFSDAAAARERDDIAARLQSITFALGEVLEQAFPPPSFERGDGEGDSAPAEGGE